MVLDTLFPNAQYYKVCIKGKVEQSREKSSAFLTLRRSSIMKRDFSDRPWIRSPIFIQREIDRQTEAEAKTEIISEKKK